MAGDLPLLTHKTHICLMDVGFMRIQWDTLGFDLTAKKG